MSDTLELQVDGLHEPHPGLTKALSESYAEAASVCWSRHHESPVTVSLRHLDTNLSRVVYFNSPSTRVRKAYANELDTTETGAYGVSLAAVEEIADLVAVSRAETLTGADWYVALKGAAITDLEECIRLEVSGVDAGTMADVERRLRVKVAQAARGDSNLPAMAAVVGFKVLEIAISALQARR